MVPAWCESDKGGGQVVIPWSVVQLEHEEHGRVMGPRAETGGGWGRLPAAAGYW